MGWVLGLVIFLALTTSAWGKAKLDLAPMVGGALRVLLASLTAIFALEALKLGIASGGLGLLEGLLAPKASIAIYFIFQIAWAAMYSYISRYLGERSRLTPIGVVETLSPKGGAKDPAHILG